MRSVSSMTLMGFISLALVSEVYAKEDLRIGQSFADGPCTSESKLLCEMSAQLRTVVIEAERIMTAQLSSAAKAKPKPVASKPAPPKALESVKKFMHTASTKRHSRRGPDVWGTYHVWGKYLTTFKPTGMSAMPVHVHRLSDPIAANRKAKDLLDKAHPVLKILAYCESKMRQYDEKTGLVVRGSVTPGDIGLLQINSNVHEDTARELGYNYYSIYGNIGFAHWLYIMYGTDPWESSRARCWDSKIPPRLRLPLRKQV